MCEAIANSIKLRFMAIKCSDLRSWVCCVGMLRMEKEDVKWRLMWPNTANE